MGFRFSMGSSGLPDNTVIRKSVIRKYVGVSLLIVTPLGFLFKFYAGPGKWWFNNYGAGLLYEVFWILIIFLFIPRRSDMGPTWGRVRHGVAS